MIAERCSASLRKHATGSGMVLKDRSHIGRRWRFGLLSQLSISHFQQIVQSARFQE